MADGAGAASGPLRRRLRWPRDQQQPGSVPARRETEPSEEPPSHRVSGGLERDILALYLSDHLTGATAGVERARRMAAAYRSSPIGADLGMLADQVVAEHAFVET